MKTIQIPDTLIKHNGTVFAPIDEDGFKGWTPWRLPVEVVEQQPTLLWTGAKIPIASVWHPICAFFEEQYKLTRGEAQARLFYNPATRIWKVWAFPQEWSSGMSTTEINHEASCTCLNCQAREEQREQMIGSGFMVYGTIHHHCGSSAFQSGVDQDNEVHQNGIHITIGHVGQKDYDLHGRVYLNQVKYTCSWSNWFDLSEPAWLRSIPDEALKHLKISREDICDKILTAPPPASTTFPKVWMENLVKKEYQSNTYNYRSTGGSWNHHTNSWEHTTPDVERTEKQPTERTMYMAVIGMAKKHKIDAPELRDIISKLARDGYCGWKGESASRFITSVSTFTTYHGLTIMQLAKVVEKRLGEQQPKQPHAERSTTTSEHTIPFGEHDRFSQEIIDEMALLCATVGVTEPEAWSLFGRLRANPLAGNAVDKGNYLEKERAFLDGARALMDVFNIDMDYMARVVWNTSAEGIRMAQARICNGGVEADETDRRITGYGI